MEVSTGVEPDEERINAATVVAGQASQHDSQRHTDGCDEETDGGRGSRANEELVENGAPEDVGAEDLREPQGSTIFRKEDWTRFSAPRQG